MMDYRNNYNNENETNNENMMAAEQNSFNGKKPSSKNKKLLSLQKNRSHRLKRSSVRRCCRRYLPGSQPLCRKHDSHCNNNHCTADDFQQQPLKSRCHILKLHFHRNDGCFHDCEKRNAVDRLHHKPVRTGSTELLQHVRLRCPDSADRGDHKLRFRYHHRKE